MAIKIILRNEGPKRGSLARTARATSVRKGRYYDAITRVAPAIATAKAAGGKTAAEIAAYLNEQKIAPPVSDTWKPDAVLRCLRLLKKPKFFWM